MFLLYNFSFWLLLFIYDVSERWRCTLGHHQGNPWPQVPADAGSRAGCPGCWWFLWWPSLRPAPWWRPWGYTHRAVWAEESGTQTQSTSLCQPPPIFIQELLARAPFYKQPGATAPSTGLVVDVKTSKFSHQGIWIMILCNDSTAVCFYTRIYNVTVTDLFSAQVLRVRESKHWHTCRCDAKQKYWSKGHIYTVHVFTLFMYFTQ